MFENWRRRYDNMVLANNILRDKVAKIEAKCDKLVDENTTLHEQINAAIKLLSTKPGNKNDETKHIYCWTTKNLG